MGKTSPFILVHIISFFFQTTTALSTAKPGCPEKCRNITVPYPFGIGKGCYIDKPFELTCNESSNSPFALQSSNGFTIFDISPDYLTVGDIPFSGCLTPGEHVIEYSSPALDRHFRYSGSRNKFVAMGCDLLANVYDPNNHSRSVEGCTSACRSSSDPGLSFSGITCSGIECCQSPMPNNVASFDLQIKSFNRFTSACMIAFVSHKDFTDYYVFNVQIGQNMSQYRVPVVLNWAVGNGTCAQAVRENNVACGENSYCVDQLSGTDGYNCRCSQGYQGNPYLPNGCQDIDECESRNNSCTKGAMCINTRGSYICTCPNGYQLKNTALGYECVRDQSRHQFALIVLLCSIAGIGPLAMMAIGVWLHKKLQRRKNKKNKEKFFKRNGGLLLQQHISAPQETVTKTKLFTAEELEKATDGFNKTRVLGKGGHGTVYKGMLPDGSIVAVKKSNTVRQNQISQFINEVFILSQINHRNIVKLLGCCLEYEVPLLVYEYVSNGTLSYHLSNNNHKISWKNRLQIAVEVGGALAYLHSYASTSIFHRDIKSSNILLDENFRAIVSDFGLSRSIPFDKTHLTTVVGGTFGYLDPEYFRSGQFTDKSDVYAFGILLSELLTGKIAISCDSSDEGLVIRFQSLMKQNLLFDIIDGSIANEGSREEIGFVAEIAKRCLKRNAKKRPSMKEIMTELEQIIRRGEVVPSQSRDQKENKDDFRYLRKEYLPEKTELKVRGSRGSHDRHVMNSV